MKGSIKTFIKPNKKFGLTTSGRFQDDDED